MSSQKAVWSTKDTRVIKDVPIPVPEGDEVLIKNVAVASNPKDWKLPAWIPGYETVEGNDVAGYVEAVGSSVTKFKKGDKVAAFTVMRAGDKYGAYAEYSISPENTVTHLGPNSTFEDAAALPLAYLTAAIGLFKRLRLPTPDSPCNLDPPTPILIWGGATTVGVYAIQLAKRAGLYVVAVAGSNTAHATSYGADEVIDYRGKSHDELVKAVKAAAGGRIRHSYDCISENGTIDVIVEALSPEGGRGTYVLLYSDEVLSKLPANVLYDRTFVGTAHGQQGDDKAFSEEYFTNAGEWLEEGTLKPQKITVVPGGLAGVDSGLKKLQENKVSAEKLVYIVADTPGLK